MKDIYNAKYKIERHLVCGIWLVYIKDIENTWKYNENFSTLEAAKEYIKQMTENSKEFKKEEYFFDENGNQMEQ